MSEGKDLGANASLPLAVVKRMLEAAEQGDWFDASEILPLLARCDEAEARYRRALTAIRDEVGLADSIGLATAVGRLQRIEQLALDGLGSPEDGS